MVWQVRENPQNCNFELNRHINAENIIIRQEENSRETTKSPSPLIQTGSCKAEVESRASTTSRTSTSSVELGPAPGSGLVTADASDAASGEDIPDNNIDEISTSGLLKQQEQEENSRETTTPPPASENNNVDNHATSADLGLEMTESMTASSLIRFNRDIESMMDHSEALLEPKEDFTQNLS